MLRTVAWSAPVVLATVAAPAMAASAAPANLKFNNLSVYGGAYDGTGHPKALDTNLQVQNVYDATTSTPPSITVVVSFPSNRVSNANPTAVSGANWTFTSISTSGGLRRFTFTYTTPLAPGSSTSTLAFEVALSNNGAGAVVVAAAASGANATTANTSTSYTLS